MTMFARRIATSFLAVLLSFAGLSASVPSVGAHGADWEVRMVGQRVGSYDVTVRTAPKEPRTGRLHIEVQLIAPDSLTYVDRATVTATAEFRGQGNVRSGPALSRYRAPWHEMDLTLNKSGAWDVRLAIDGPRGREAVGFPVNVLPEASGVLSHPPSARAVLDKAKPIADHRKPL